MSSKYNFTRHEFERYCYVNGLNPKSEHDYNFFKDLVELEELVKCMRCGDWTDRCSVEIQNDETVCEFCRLWKRKRKIEKEQVIMDIFDFLEE